MNDVAAFAALHRQDRILILPNAWDAASAALFVSKGARAIATTSAGVAWSCGFPDGDALPREALLAAVDAIARVCRGVPLSVDVESGYSDDPAQVAELVSKLRALGVAGINLEDGDGPPEVLEAKLAAIERSVDVFVNARADVFLRELAAGERAVRETSARIRRYENAGAEAIFVPAVREAGAIAKLAAATDLPLGILAEPGLPRLPDLYALGVRRLSAGSALAKLAYGAAASAASEFLRGESADALFAGSAVEYAEMNALTARHQSGSGGV